MTTSRDFSFRELVEKIDGPDRHRDNLYPEVYQFSGGKPRRDSGPSSGIYQGTAT